MGSADLVKRIKEHGVDFDPTDAYLQILRKAGAEDAVIQALRNARPKPLTREQVGELVAGGVPSERAVMLVKQRGIDFLPDEEYFQTLHLAGADGTLITALRAASAAGIAKAKALAPPPGAVRDNPKDGLKYVWVPAGTFLMGCSPGDGDCSDEEIPAHQVTLSKGFWIGQTEVTVGAYKRFAAAIGRQMGDAPDFNSGWKNDGMPIVSVTWDDANDFCTWAGGRLVTEAEWEYAARGGSMEARYGPIDEVAWYDHNSRGRTQEVAQKRANRFGLFDTLGNVWEWVNDWYDKNYYKNSPPQDPSGPTSGKYRLLRGGDASLSPGIVRVSFRYSLEPTASTWRIGVRCGGEVLSP